MTVKAIIMPDLQNAPVNRLFQIWIVIPGHEHRQTQEFNANMIL